MKRIIRLWPPFVVSALCLFLPAKARATFHQLAASEKSIIERIEAVRSAYSQLQGKTDDEKRSGDAGQLAQWFNWPNWPNWNNWGNWPNWGNFWRNY